MGKKPLVSIVVPAYKAENFIRKCMDSLLSQTYEPIEIIVVYDPSPDTTLRILEEEYEGEEEINLIRLRSEANAPVARNVGMRYVEGKYVAFCDADDYFTPDKIEKQVNFLRNHPQIGCVYTDYEKVYEKGGKIEKIQLPDWNRGKWLSEHFIRFSTIMVRRKSIETIMQQDGYYFDEQLPPCEDLDFLIRLSRETEFARIPEALTFYRIHQESLSTKINKMNITRARVEMKHSLILQFVKNLFFIIPKDHLLSKLFPFLYEQRQSLAENLL